MKKILIILLFSSFNGFCQKELTCIGFGSCCLQRNEQLIWRQVVKHKPQLWISLGDNIYANTTSMEKMKSQYKTQLSNYNYQQLLATCPLIGTWDDHDFGANDIGKEYTKKDESQQLFLDFIGEPKDSPRWKQKGVYTSYIYGTGERQVKVILLDLRYFRDPIGSDGDMLGEEQWKWLENELNSSKAAINLIGSSIAFVSDLHPFEKWGNFPKEKQRMLNLLKRTPAKGVIFLSGDRHFAEISLCREKDFNRYHLYDFTSSGLTHSRWFLPFDNNPQRVGRRYMRKNFGLILIDWEKKTVTLQAHTFRDLVKIERVISFAELSQL